MSGASGVSEEKARKVHARMRTAFASAADGHRARALGELPLLVSMDLSDHEMPFRLAA